MASIKSSTNNNDITDAAEVYEPPPMLILNIVPVVTISDDDADPPKPLPRRASQRQRENKGKTQKRKSKKVRESETDSDDSGSDYEPLPKKKKAKTPKPIKKTKKQKELEILQRTTQPLFQFLVKQEKDIPRVFGASGHWLFSPFELKKNMTVAPLHRRVPLTPEEKCNLMNIKIEESDYLQKLPRRPASKR